MFRYTKVASLRTRAGARTFAGTGSSPVRTATASRTTGGATELRIVLTDQTRQTVPSTTAFKTRSSDATQLESEYLQSLITLVDW